ncbi:MAG: hypothetical protein AAB538_00425, partial [Patescibacteria group bacterium]
ERKIMPAGDVFNLQHIADFILRFDYPNRENRLPGFPALLLLTRPFPVDPVQAAVGVSIALSSLMLACLYGIGRTLGIHRVPLFATLSLSIFDPLLTIGAVRPLSDATFLFFLSLYLFLVIRVLAGEEAPAKRWLVFIGLATIAMMFTRFEGVVVAALTLPLLWFKLPWKKVVATIAIPFVTGLLWIPVHLHIHGSLAGGYIAAFADPSGDFGNLSTVPSKILIMVKSAGWGTAWTLPAYELEQEPNEEALQRLVIQGTWWLSILAILGIPWLLITKRSAALPLLLAAAGYMCILSLWFLYSRFVVPLVPIFYLTVAAGGSFLMSAIAGERSRPNYGDLARGAGLPSLSLAKQDEQRMKNRSHNLGRLEASLILATIFFGWILWTEAPRLYHQALSRAWESNQKGYSLFDGLRQTAKLKEPTAYWTEAHAFATLYLKEHGFYFNRRPNDSPEELHELMQENKIKHLINSGDDTRVPELRKLLQERGNVASTTTYRALIWGDGSLETTDVDHLVW